METANDSENKLAKVRWRCRRGMLELDMMLLGFFDAAYADMSLAKQQLFEDMLEADDQDLQRWLVGSEACSNPKWQDIILVIRHMHALHKQAQPA